MVYGNGGIFLKDPKAVTEKKIKTGEGRPHEQL